MPLTCTRCVVLNLSFAVQPVIWLLLGIVAIVRLKIGEPPANIESIPVS